MNTVGKKNRATTTKYLTVHPRIEVRQSDLFDPIFVRSILTFPNVVPCKTRLVPGSVEDDNQTTTSPPCLSVPAVCASKNHFADRPAIFIRRLPRTWCGISGSPCARIIGISTQCLIKYVHNLHLTQSLCIDCCVYDSSVKQLLQNKSGRQKVRHHELQFVFCAYGNLYQ